MHQHIQVPHNLSHACTSSFGVSSAAESLYPVQIARNCWAHGMWCVTAHLQEVRLAPQELVQAVHGLC